MALLNKTPAAAVTPIEVISSSEIEDAMSTITSTYLQACVRKTAIMSMSPGNKDPIKVTPLARISAGVNGAHKFLGYPYKVVDGAMVFSSFKSWAVIITATALCLGAPYAYSVELQRQYQEDSWTLVQAKSGQSTLDLLTAASSTALSFAVSIFIICKSKRKTGGLNEIFDKLCLFDHGSIGVKSHLRIKRLATRFAFAFFAFLLVFITAAFWFNYTLVFKDLGYGHWKHWALFLIGMISPIYFYLNPVLCATSCLLIFVYGCISECYMELFKMVKSLPKTDKDAKKIIEYAQGIEHLLKHIKTVLEVDLFVVCGAYLLYLSMHTYSGMCALLDMDRLYKVLIGIISVILDFMFFSVFYALYNTGQQVEDSRSAAREALEDYMVNKQFERGHTKSSFKMIIRRLRQAGPVSPFSAFALNHSGLMSAVTVSLTYWIVLMQFKVSE